MVDLEKEAQNKYSPTEIGMMKKAGDWPPLELLRGSLGKKNKPELKVDWDQLGKAADQTRARWKGEYDNYRKEKAYLKERVPDIDQELLALEKQKLAAHAQDMATGMVGKGKLAELENREKDLRKEKKNVKRARDQMGDVRRRINMGELVYTAQDNARKFDPEKFKPQEASESQ
jgi:hypothetical protein